MISETDPAPAGRAARIDDTLCAGRATGMAKRPVPVSRSLPRLAAVLGALCTAAVTVVIAPAPALAAAVDYVALGDSYSSGVGASGTSGSCSRSDRAYGPLYAAAADVASFRFPACGGAVTQDVIDDQLSAVDSRTDLISITIGGNDAGFATTAATCVLGSDAVCAGAVASARRYITGTLPGRLDATYAAIRQRSPGATVVVLGYPRLFETTATCGIAGLSLAKRQAMNAAADDLATVISARAGAAGFRFADARPAFAGHGVCASREWITRVNPLNVGTSYHPNTNGYALGYLPAFRSALD